MARLNVTTQDKSLEDSLATGEILSVNPDEFHRIAQSIAERKKDAVVNVRINSLDLQSLKEKARKMGVKYQTFISELLHRVATN